jgi:acetyl-CoA acetyltransferase
VRDVSITGVGITRFGKFPDVSLRALGVSAIDAALCDAELSPRDVDLVVHANAVAGLITGQEMTRGQVVTSGTGLAGLPLINVENACAGSATAVHIALIALRSGGHLYTSPSPRDRG